MRVAVLILDGVFDLGLAAVLDTLGLANELAPAASRGKQLHFDVAKVGVRKHVKTAQGLAVTLDTRPERAPDLVIVPALGAKTPATLDAALATTELADAGNLLVEWAEKKARVAAACTATFLVASTGLLDRRAATTTWWLAPTFRDRFPAVKLDEARILVEAANVVTAGAALAHLDLALWLVQSKSPTLARVVARHLTFDRRPSQAAYVMPNHVAHSDPLVERFEAWARGHLTAFSVGAAARAVGVSERTLERRVQHAIGRSPLSFVQDVRIEDAMHQLETTERGVDEIAELVGYQDGVTLRTLLRRKTGLGVRELRSRSGAV